MYNVMICRVRNFVWEGWALGWILPRAGLPNLKTPYKLDKLQNTAGIHLNKTNYPLESSGCRPSDQLFSSETGLKPASSKGKSVKLATLA